MECYLECSYAIYMPHVELHIRVRQDSWGYPIVLRTDWQGPHPKGKTSEARNHKA